MRGRPHLTLAARGRGGFTLIEVLLVVVLVSGLATALTLAYGSTISRANTTHRRNLDLFQAAAVLEEIEEGIRASHAIKKAGSDVLEIVTRYYLDLDPEVEHIRYSVAGEKLLREIAHGSGAYGPPETLLATVVEFDALAFQLKDHLDAGDYGSGAPPLPPPGDDLNADTKVRVEYKLRDLNKVDGDFAAEYDESLEALKIATDDASLETVTISPPLRRSAARASVLFSPEDAGVEYRPIVYGDEALGADSISVVFGADHAIRVRTVEGGATVDEDISPLTWKPGVWYELRWIGGSAKTYALVRTPSSTTQWKRIGVISPGSIDDARFHLQNPSAGTSAVWDDLSVDYDFIEVHLAVDLQGIVRHLYGGATRRQP